MSLHHSILNCLRNNLLPAHDESECARIDFTQLESLFKRARFGVAPLQNYLLDNLKPFIDAVVDVRQFASRQHSRKQILWRIRQAASDDKDFLVLLLLLIYYSNDKTLRDEIVAEFFDDDDDCDDRVVFLGESLPSGDAARWTLAARRQCMAVEEEGGPADNLTPESSNGPKRKFVLDDDASSAEQSNSKKKLPSQQQATENYMSPQQQVCSASRARLLHRLEDIDLAIDKLTEERAKIERMLAAPAELPPSFPCGHNPKASKGASGYKEAVACWKRMRNDASLAAVLNLNPEMHISSSGGRDAGILIAEHHPRFKCDDGSKCAGGFIYNCRIQDGVRAYYRGNVTPHTCMHNADN